MQYFQKMASLLVAIVVLGGFFALAVTADLSAQSCKGLSEQCLDAGECCSYVCENSKCSCYQDGAACIFDRHCCGGACKQTNPDVWGGFCGCLAEGKSCNDVSQCCSGNCENGKCAADPTTYENFDLSCVNINQNLAPIDEGYVTFKAEGVSCLKNGQNGLCDGKGHCVFSFPPPPSAVGNDTCQEACAQSGRAGGACLPVNWFPGVNWYPFSYCGVGAKCLMNLNNSLYRPHIYCAGEANCYCYDLQDEVCLPGCEQRCFGGQGCKPPITENCCNGVDDDFNGLVDDDDPACTGPEKIINLQEGINYPCWQKISQADVFNKTTFSPVFTCPDGYWARFIGSVIPRSHEAIVIKDSQKNKEFDYIVAITAKSAYDVILPASKIIITYIHGSAADKNSSQDILLSQSGQLGVKIKSWECFSPKSLGCDQCGATGILFGILNLCDKDECAALGDCYFQPGGFGLSNKCFSSAGVNFKLLDVVDKSPLSGVRIDIKATNDYCITNKDGFCSVRLGIGGKYRAVINQEGYVCGGSSVCEKEFEVKTNPAEIVLEINKVVVCSDTDATEESPSGRGVFRKKGTVRDSFGFYTDSCSSASILKEYYCENNKAAFEDFSCPAGCADGVCKSWTDEEYGNIFVQVKGENNPAAGVNVAFHGGWGFSCFTDKDGKCFIEKVFNDSYSAFVNHPFYKCEEPGCPKNIKVAGNDVFAELFLKNVPNNTQSLRCHDSDGSGDKGKDEKALQTKGAVNILYPMTSKPTAYIDFCMDTKRLREYYCTGDKMIGILDHQCLYGCEDGACRKRDPEQCLKAGEELIFSNQAHACCPGLTRIDIDYSKAVCMDCGDGNCVYPETNENCPADCPAPPKTCVQCSWPCSESKCLVIGTSCVFVDNKCIDKKDIQGSVNLEVNVKNESTGKLITEKVVFVSATIGPQEKANCETMQSGKCFLGLALANVYTINASVVGYEAKSLIIELLSPNEPALVILLKPIPNVQPSPASYSLSLAKGWNFISLPIQPENSAIQNVLSSIVGKFDAVIGLDGAYDPNLSEQFNSLKKVEYNKGYEIKMNTAAILQVQGSALNYSPRQWIESLNLQTGWNKIGVSLLSPVKIAGLIPADWQGITTYNPFDPPEIKKELSYSEEIGKKDFEEFKPGQGYFVRVDKSVKKADIIFEIVDGVATAQTNVKHFIEKANVVISLGASFYQTLTTNSAGKTSEVALEYDKFYKLEVRAAGYRDFVDLSFNVMLQPSRSILISLDPIDPPLVPPVNPAEKTVSSDEDGSVSIKTNQLDLRCTIPAGALPESPAKAVIKAVPAGSGTIALQGGEGKIIGDYVFDVTVEGQQSGNQIKNFNDYLIIEVYYPSELLPRGVDPKNLAIYFYDETAGRWEILKDIEVDSRNNIVRGKINHLTRLTLVASVPGTAKDIKIDVPTAEGQIGELCCSGKQKWTGVAGVAFNKDNQGCGTGGDCYADCFTNNTKGEEACLIGLNKNGQRYRAYGVASVCVPKGAVAICPFGPNSIEDIIDSITKWIFYFAVIIAPLFIIIGAFMFLTSAGDTAKVTKAKQIIIWACVGLAIILFARGIFSLIKSIIGFS